MDRVHNTSILGGWWGEAIDWIRVWVVTLGQGKYGFGLKTRYFDHGWGIVCCSAAAACADVWGVGNFGHGDGAREGIAVSVGIDFFDCAE